MNIKVVRNWMNTVFIFSALIGMYLYYTGNRETGTYVILAAIVLKFCESALRIMKRHDEE
jgi:hypothetical protein